MSRLPNNDDRLDNLPITRIKRESRWLRISRTAYPSPLFFNTAPGGRFNPKSGEFGTLYCARDLVGVLAESICRGAANMPRNQRIVSADELAAQGLYQIDIAAPLRVADFTIAHLARYGLDARIYAEYEESDEEYHFGPAWADHLRTLGLDGILYPSRHHTTSQCLALFEQTDRELSWVLLSTLLNSEPVLKVLEDTFDWGII